MVGTVECSFPNRASKSQKRQPHTATLQALRRWFLDRLGSESRRHVDVGTMILLEREIPGCHLSYPRPQTFLSKGDRQKQRVFLTFYETSLQICSQRSRGPQGWHSWTAAGLRERGTTAWRPARTSGALLRAMAVVHASRAVSHRDSVWKEPLKSCGGHWDWSNK